MRLVFDDRALNDLQLVVEWVARHDARAADALIGRIFDKVERLTAPELTDMGRPGREPGTRELIEYPYIKRTTTATRLLCWPSCTERRIKRE
ncbi:MAG TPA: type II toxin-antitoxin system RelE/ParE family toxin [Stellaceae bacterium]|jgi:plasmid stabilization system protein ParE|nr:type II toxin-antitoxin system RelE/ParE family toxin [Stellaceae bacterium]